MKSLAASLTAKPPWLVLLISLTISFFAAHITNLQSEKTGQERFQRQVEKLNADILHHLDTYLGLLRAGVGVYYASDSLNRSEWQKFVETLEIQRFYPGIQGIGYAQYFPHSEREAFEAAIRAEGFENFTLEPSYLRDYYAPVTFLEPFDWRNQRAFGYDMLSEPVRRAAMERARDTGEASISSYVVLVQETDKDVQAGFLMYLPVYRGKFVPEDLMAKRAQLQGFVYAPFRMKKLLANIADASATQLIYRITDTADAVETLELFHSDPDETQTPGSFFDQRDMTFAGRTWQINTLSTEAFDLEQTDNSALLVLIAGLVDSLLLFIMALTLFSHRRSALENAEQLSDQLHLSKKFQQMADFAPTALITVDKHGKIDLYNQQALQLFGYSEQELVGLSIEDLVPHRFRAEHPEYRAKYLQKPEQRAMGSGRDLYCQTKNGVELPVDIAIMPAQLNKSGYTVCSIVDISERKRQENLLRRKSSDLEQFVYAVSHDLKSPLVAISGLADLVSSKLENNEDSELDYLVQRISANTRQMERLLNDLLEVSRVAYKALELEPVDITDLAEQVLLLNKEAVEACGGSLNVTFTEGCFNAHKTLLLQLYTNFISNAVKYRSPLRTLKVDVSMQTDNKGSFISQIKDNGIGISPEWQSRVFDLFVRKGEGDGLGSGVGLSICKSVVERHHGSISVESEEDAGATFLVTIPAQTGSLIHAGRQQ
ncbi:CHASE domain-containing protein [Simiduia curdlanivorans]|uniref:histidine kinase n=1 Tax=Simiduia curdlanivorans TaxID=1492769 RepID=A0ABV8V6C4_9GAMM|nr:CHASE domain-containing protein [Simiduia curdlanivorans]MDN3638619.1 CHASE domain-containing protein [Simiduia curdlanivorans]